MAFQEVSEVFQQVSEALQGALQRIRGDSAHLWGHFKIQKIFLGYRRRYRSVSWGPRDEFQEVFSGISETFRELTGWVSDVS